jgi:hypothetical protein
MAVDTRHQSQLTGLPYDQQLRYANSPQFSNPWGTSAPVSGQIYASSQPSMDNSSLPQRQNLTLPPYQALPLTSTALASGPSLQTAFGNQTQSYAQYPTTTSAAYQAAPTSGYANGGFAYPGDPARRPSHS